MKGRRSWFWAQGLACGVLAASAAPLALALGVALAPLGLCAAAGAGGLARIMAVYAVAALAPWGWELWAVARDWPGALQLIADGRLPAMAWAAQGAAWLLSQVAPFVARLAMESRVKARAARLRDARARLAADWGLET